MINGDFVDFLAERRRTKNGPDNTSHDWGPFIESPDEAVDVFRRIVDRDASIFRALRDFLRRSGRLTLLLGNHDLELSLPAVRRELESVLDSEGRDLRWIYDGEAYSIGTVLIEHGNRYDKWNVVQHDALRRLRSAQSRGENQRAQFTAPAGSHLVAGVVNRIKEAYPFVDLLKPEDETVLPILLALAPEYRRHVFALARLASRAHGRRYGLLVQAATLGDTAADQITEVPDGREVVTTALRDMLPRNEIDAFVQEILGDATGEPVLDGDAGAGANASTVWGVIQLLSSPRTSPLATRLNALRSALQATRVNMDFCRTRERKGYLEAARSLCASGFRVVVFGHTHLAKCINLEGEGLYLNTGTWADLIEFPISVLDPAKPGAPDPLVGFVDDMANGRLDRYVRFSPTYARIVLDGSGSVVSADLMEFGGANDRLSD